MAGEDALVAQSLECCLCFELFTQPKLLSCAHTFCKECLVRLYESHPQENQLSCPMCRQITEVSNGDISKLQTNILINSIIEDIKSAKSSCTVCDQEAKSPAVKYCAQCDEYMCESCTVAHEKFKRNAKHDVVSTDDVKRGRVNVKRFCGKHPEEEKLYVCLSCKVSICFRCRVIDHDNPGHEIKEISDHKKTIQKQIQSLLTKATSTIAIIEAHTELVKEQKAVVEVELHQKIAEINQSYEEEVNYLTRQRNDLTDRCKQENASHIAQLEKIKESNDKTLSCIRSASMLVGNGIKTSLQGETLAVHDMICCDLEKMLDGSSPDATQPKLIADHVEQMKFIKRATTPNSLGQLRTVVPAIWRAHSMYLFICYILLPLVCLGFAIFVVNYSGAGLKQSDWELNIVKEIPFSPVQLLIPWDAMPLPDGRVAIVDAYASNMQGIVIFTADGPQETVLRGEESLIVSVLSDGRYIVKDTADDVILYTQAWERRHVRFNTLPFSESDTPYAAYGAWGGMCVDGDDNIYVGNYDGNGNIAVFRPEGGKPIREIPCHEYMPFEILHMSHSRMLVVCDQAKSTRIIDDEKGTILHHIKVNCQLPHAAVLKDDTLLIGCRSTNALLSIELYTKDLTRVRTVLRDYPLDDLVKLVELTTGEIAVVSTTKLTIFPKIYTS